MAVRHTQCILIVDLGSCNHRRSRSVVVVVFHVNPRKAIVMRSIDFLRILKCFKVCRCLTEFSCISKCLRVCH
jgi:hypothetical protein